MTMNEATITIKKLWPPYKPGDKKTSLEDADGNKYRINVTTAAGFHDGDVVEIGWTPEETSPEFGAKKYKQIQNMKRVSAGPPLTPGAAAVRPSDVGPHVGMWEKEAFTALRAGMGDSEVIIMGIAARHIALAIVRASLDEKPAPKPDFDDSLEF